MNYQNAVNKNDIYDINNFYIGQLLINLCDNQSTNDLLNKKFILKMQSNFDTVIKNGDDYYVITIFYKLNNDLICLHNFKNYKVNECNFLYSLRMFFPKIDFEIPKQIKFSEALMIFRYMFDMNLKDSFETMNTNYLYNISDYYVGNLYLKNNVSSHENEIYKYILRKSSAKNITFNDAKDYDSIYKCLFYQSTFGLYNLNNNNYHHLNKCIEQSENSYYEVGSSFLDFLNQNNFQCDNKEISMKTAFRLFKKYNI